TITTHGQCRDLRHQSLNPARPVAQCSLGPRHRLVVAAEEEAGKRNANIRFESMIVQRAELHRPLKVFDGFSMLAQHRINKTRVPPGHQKIGMERQAPFDVAYPLLKLAVEIGDAEAARREGDRVVLSRLQRTPGCFLSQRLYLTKPTPIGEA